MHIPVFERTGFAVAAGSGGVPMRHEGLDMIVRIGYGAEPHSVQVGVVSREYALIQHSAVVDAAKEHLAEVGIQPEGIQASLTLSRYGERMALSLFLPERYRFDPGDGHPMALRLECFNSVDGGMRMRVLLGWFRFVCSNGMVVGVTRSGIQRRHVGEFMLRDMREVLSSGLKGATEEMENFRRWSATEISLAEITPWIDSTVRNTWGPKATARLYHIAASGRDVDVAGPYRGMRPSTVPVREGLPVSGSSSGCRNLYDVSQALAWLARERRELQEQLTWREQIPELMGELKTGKL